MFEYLTQPDWTTAIASGVFAAISSGVTSWVAWARYRRTYRLEDRTEWLLRTLLKDRRFPGRSRKFTSLRHFVPLSDDRLREALLKAGAIRFENREREELWGLIESHMDKVSPKISR